MNPKSVRIKLTDKQRLKLRNLTGIEHKEVRFESFTGQAETLAPKAALRSRATMAKKLAGKKALGKKLAGRKPMARKLAGKKAMAKKLAGRRPMAKKLTGKKAMAKKLAGRKSLARKSALRVVVNHTQVSLIG